LAGATAPEELTWIEERVEGGTWHQYSSAVEQQVEEHSAEDNEQGEQGEDDLFRISTRLKERYQTLLAATAADWKRGSVGVLKCRLFRDWVGFKRHCDTTEAHPVAFSFCTRCGDFFARGDAHWRHRNNPPNACIDVTPDEAEFKRRETNRVQEGFSVWRSTAWRPARTSGRRFHGSLRLESQLRNEYRHYHMWYRLFVPTPQVNSVPESSGMDSGLLICKQL
jgi:hypothetical protein